MKVSGSTICSMVIILFHAVGLYGFHTPELNALFLKLVPFHLLLMLLLLIISGYDRSAGILTFGLVIYSAGFLVEVAGVNTGIIFGPYSYGNTLGAKVWGTPLIIGVNWLILIYSTGVLLHRYHLGRFISSLIGALIMVFIDFFIEPVAVKYDYWNWSDGIIPLQNYLGWFVVSFLLLLIFASLNFKKQNPSAIVLLIAQICFFIILNK